MRKIKLSITTIALMIGVIAATAFNSKNTFKKGPGSVYYIYTAGATDPDNPANFTSTGSNTIPVGCTGNGTLCAVFLANNGTHPNQSDLDAIQEEITTAISSGTPTSHVKLRSGGQ